MPVSAVQWPGNLDDGPDRELYKPWFEPTLPLAISPAARMVLDAVLEAYDQNQISLQTALVAELVLLTYGWSGIDFIANGQGRLQTFWEHVFLVTRSDRAKTYN